jgi:predicted nucleic acid-binding protein
VWVEINLIPFHSIYITSYGVYIVNILKSLDVTPFVAKQGRFYWQQFHKKLQNLSLADCLIAATANVHEVTLVTLNRKHFPMKDIKLLDF